MKQAAILRDEITKITSADFSGLTAISGYSYHIWRYIYIDTYHSRFIPEGVAEASQISLRHVVILVKRWVLPKLRK
jgi:hypothetical protein